MDIALFFTGFVQVVFVAVNTWQIAHQQKIDLKLFSIFFVGFMISFVWSFNVKRVAFGGWSDRIWYALGAGCGTIAGVLIALVLRSRRK